MQSSDYEKLSSNSQLIKGKLQDLQKVLKYLNGTTKSLSHVSLSAGVSRIISVFTRCTYLVVVCHAINTNFIASIIHFISKINFKYVFKYNKSADVIE